MTGFVVVLPPWILLEDWSWGTAVDLLAHRWPAVAVFPSRRRANQARCSYGGAVGRAMSIVRIRP